MTVIVTGAAETARYLQDAVDRAGAVAGATANYAAVDIEEAWEAAIPVGPSGMTSSDPMNVSRNLKTPHANVVGAVVESNHFVVGFLQFGTSRMAPRVDLYGIAAPHINAWVTRLGNEMLR